MLAAALCVGLPASSAAGPWLAPGDSGLRSDLQLLADAGLISIPLMTWPLAWGDVAAALDRHPSADSPAELAALARVERRLAEATADGVLRIKGRAALAANPRLLRTFEDGPRGEAEAGLGIEWTGSRFAFNLEGEWVDDPIDDQDFRGDGSYLGVALGNWMFAGAIADRWWGPGWHGSLIFGSNTRPIPALTVERNLTTPFETRWLSWIGPWDFALVWGFLEDGRAVPNARLFGLRFDFRPLQSLEIGLSRTAMWCGSGRPCGFDTFGDLLLGRDNRGENVAAEDEPGNQLAGIDLRWSTGLGGRPLALYTQWIGEDENNFFPTNWLGQFGAETWGRFEGLGNWRAFLEWSDTECNFRFYRSVRGDDSPGEAKPGCAYNHPIYRSGYRYRDRAIGHSFDGDSSVFTLGGVLTDNGDHQWILTIAAGNLNRRSARPSTVADSKTRYREIELVHKRSFAFGRVDVGLGYDDREDTVTGAQVDDVRAFVNFVAGY